LTKGPKPATPPPTAYVAMPIKVAKKNLLLHLSPLAIPFSLAVHLSYSVPWLLSVCLWGAGVAARLAGSIGKHVGSAVRWVHDRPETRGSGHGGYGGGREGVFFLRVSPCLIHADTTQPHRHKEVAWWDLDLYLGYVLLPPSLIQGRAGPGKVF